MESDKKTFDTDNLEQGSSDFLEYQHKKLEKVAEIIKEEERAAKLLEETENAAINDAPKTKIVIDSIVKHDKSSDTLTATQEDDSGIEGLYIEPVDTEPNEQLFTMESNDSSDDQSTFEAIDEVIQAAQTNFELAPESNELVMDEERALSQELGETNENKIELEVFPEIDLDTSESGLDETLTPELETAEIEVVDGLVIETPSTVSSNLSERSEEYAADIVTSADLLGGDTEDEVVDEVSDAVVDFAAAEEATEAEAAQQTTAVDYAQPKISKIGRLLLELGKISRSDTKKILRTQKKHGLLFGDAALKLGLINDDDIQKVVAMQFNYHYLQAGQGKFSDDLVAAYAPFSKKVENYRALRSQLMMRWFKKGHRALAIVGANSGDGVSYLAANLGVVFSQLGARTLIIEANMRSPRQKDIFNIRTHSGLSDMIVGKIGRDAIQEIESIPDLSVLHAGTVPPNPQELLGRTSFNILFKNLSDDYDVILIDTPPVVQSADAQSVIEMSEGAMLVSRLHQTRHADVLEMRHLIEMTGASIVSAVMNEF